MGSGMALRGALVGRAWNAGLPAIPGCASVSCAMGAAAMVAGR